MHRHDDHRVPHHHVHTSRRLSGGFRSKQLLETLELTAEAIRTGSTNGSLNGNSFENERVDAPRILSTDKAISSVTRIKLMAIAKRKTPTESIGPKSAAIENSSKRSTTANAAIRAFSSKEGKRLVCRTSNNSKTATTSDEKSSATAADALKLEAKTPTCYRVGTFETKDGTTWKASIQGDIEKFMFPSLRLESLYSTPKEDDNKKTDTQTALANPTPDQVTQLLAESTMTVEWEMEPKCSTSRPISTPNVEIEKRSDFDRKLEAAEVLLCEKEYDPSLLFPQLNLRESHKPNQDSVTAKPHLIARNPAPESHASSLYQPDVIATSQRIPRLPQTRRIIKQIQRHSTQQGQIEYYADKHNLFAKWKKLQRSQQHRLPPHRLPPKSPRHRYHQEGDGSESENSDINDDDEADEQFLGALSPRSLFFYECTRHQILPEPIFSRINDMPAHRPGGATSFPGVAATLIHAVRDRHNKTDLDGLVTTATGHVVKRKRQLALHLQEFGLGDAKTRALATALEQFHSVHILDLSANRLTDEAIIPLLASLERAAGSPPPTKPIIEDEPRQLYEDNSSPKHKLSEIITRVGLAKLRDASTKGCALTTLNLSQNSIGRAGYQQIAQFLGCCRVLTHLNLSHTNVVTSGDSDDALAPLTQAMQTHPALRFVDLSDNHIGEHGGELLGEMLTHSGCSITELDISWNGICRRGAVAIGVALRSNASLKTLRLGMNRCGDQGGEQIAAALATNVTLTLLDLSRNAIGGATCVAFGVFLRQNRSLQVLQLRDNSLGPVGCRALLRASAMGSPCEIDMSVHDTIGHEASGNGPSIFDAGFPSLSSPYELRLSESPYEFAVAQELLDAALVYNRCSLSDIVHIENPLPAPGSRRKPQPKRTTLVMDVDGRCLREASSSKLWTLPSTGILCAVAKFTPPDVNRITSIAGMHTLNSRSEDSTADIPYFYLIRAVKRGISPREITTLLDLALHDVFLTTEVASVIIKHLSTTVDLLDVLGRIWPCIVDGERAFDFLRAQLPLPTDQRRLMDTFGISTIQFSTANPTGHWSLDLSDPRQSKIAIWFAILNASDARVISELHAKRTDPSQYGRGYFWRNVRFNQKPIRLTYEFFDRLPRSGVLEFDYASPVRHEDLKSPIELSDETLAELVANVGAEVCSIYMPIHKRKDLKYQLALFHLAIAGKFITCQQAHFVLQHYPKTIENCRLRILLTVHKMLIDLENFGELLERLLATDRPRIYQTLGYLNTVNPLAVDMDYDVDFEREDEKMLLRALVDLSMLSTMDVIRIDSEKSTVLVIYSMYQTNSVPSAGRISFRYVSHQALPLPSTSTTAGPTAIATSSPMAATQSQQDWLRARQQLYRFFLVGDRLRALGDNALLLSVVSPSPAPAGVGVVGGAS